MSDSNHSCFNALLPIFEDTSFHGNVIIAGPCSAESQESVIQCALSLREQGVKYFRAGLWKPRTRPGAFEGVGERGLPWLKRVQVLTGMKVLTEVGNAAHLALAVRAGMDGVWLGARTVADPFAVQSIADELKRLKATNVTVLVKNPVNPDLELWIGALERIHAAGIRRLGAIHRGFTSYSPGNWRNPPHWSIPIELHHRIPNLQLLHDPSHCSGSATKVPDLSKKAIQLGFSGLMIESHICPDLALSDANQQVRPQVIGEIIRSLPHFSNPANDDYLLKMREIVDSLDAELLLIIAKRMEICKKIGNFKNLNGIPIVQPERYASLLKNKIEEGLNLGLDPDFLKQLFTNIHTASVELQLKNQDIEPKQFF